MTSHLHTTQPLPVSATGDRLSWPVSTESELARQMMAQITDLNWATVQDQASLWIERIREKPAPLWAVERLLQEYPIHSHEGLALMHLSEALLRTPDLETAATLLGDQLGESFHNLLTRHWLPADAAESGLNLMQRLGAQGMVQAARRSLELMGQQFVLGQTIEDAIARAQRLQRERSGLRLSYDMLGEGARSDADARLHAAHYADALEALCHQAAQTRACEQRDGISVKLSALHPRFEALQPSRVMNELLPRVWSLCQMAAAANLPLTIDAEETERLDITLQVFEALLTRVARDCPQWQGLGLVIQAYQTRSGQVVDAVTHMARQSGLRVMVRLVKGAYWDSEIKRAQELGLSAYPVYTHKSHTDLSYLVCARTLLTAPDCVFPQFASHNAATLAAVLQLAEQVSHPGFELQRLHGMGEALYREVAQSHPLVPLRVYAPVGQHRDLLAYLVRRLLENGANSSFVHLLADSHVSTDVLLATPVRAHETSGVPLPTDIYAPRRNSRGLDLSRSQHRSVLQLALPHAQPQAVADTPVHALPSMLARSQTAWAHWSHSPMQERCQIMLHASDRLERELPHFASLLVREGRKTWGDAMAEVREAVDGLRYAAQQAQTLLRPLTLPQSGPGITGESNELRLVPRGVWVCISPWNFPLAIFLGQVGAALVTGNTVLAKPAEQTPFVAQAMARLLMECGLPDDVLQLVQGQGETVGAALVDLPALAGVAFTGSTAVAKRIQRALAAKPGPIVPLLAETGGINAMLVDSTALPEQVVDATVQSAFRSAGQRCSCLRLLCLHEAIADRVLDMLHGAAAELVCGDPSRFDTDVGPLIDAEAFDRIQHHLQVHHEARPLSRRLDGSVPQLLAPHLLEVHSVADVREEIFGPVLHVLRWNGSALAVIDQINAQGHGLTFGIQTRIESRAREWASRIRTGNVYVNRNMVGAVVGLQPFGGQGLSGTGPKAGGPHYLAHFCTEQTVTINTAAAGGNVELMAPVQR